MSALTGRNTNGAVEMSAQYTWTMSRFELQHTQADCLTTGTETGPRGVSKDLHPSGHNCIRKGGKP